MKIRSVEFVGSVAEPDAPPPGGLPQVAFSGRSNVGKSSLINTLLRRTRSKVARVSSQPGKTQTLNFFRINDRFLLVDLPGYGFAKVPDHVQQRWKRLVEGYLSRREGITGVVHLVDVRHDPSPLDRQMLDYLSALQIPTLVVITKIDKLGRGRRKEQIDSIRDTLALDPEQVLPFSAKTGEGRDDLLEAIEHLVESSEQREDLAPRITRRQGADA